MFTYYWQKAHEVQQVATLRLHNAACDLGILHGHRDYTKFIVLGRGRTGSNLLNGLLNSHRHVLGFGELFQNEDTISWGVTGYRFAQRQSVLTRLDPIEFLERYIYRDLPQSIHAVGFKIFYYHAQSVRRQPIWDYLVAQPELKVIHIKRGNMLKRLLSGKRARKTGRWINQSGKREKTPPVVLDYEECLADFTQTRKWEREYERFFANHPMLTVQYESLSDDYQAEMGRIQDFLGVEAQAVTPKTHRQSNSSLASSILNYRELAEQFSGTEWRTFFEE